MAIVGLVCVDEVVWQCARGRRGGGGKAILDWVEVGVIDWFTLDEFVDVLVVLAAVARLSAGRRVIDGIIVSG